MSPTAATHLPPPADLVAVSTTTVFTGPTGVSDAQSSSSSGNTALIGPIVGGALGGVVLAVAAVVAWQLWGRSIKRKEDEKKREMVSARGKPSVHMF